MTLLRLKAMVKQMAETPQGLGPEKPLGLVGDGKVATAWLAALRVHRQPCQQWSRKLEAQGLCPPLREFLPSCGSVGVFLPDPVLPSWIESHRNPETERPHGPQSFFHASGSLCLPGVDSFHPLCAFSPARPIEPEEFFRIPFVCNDVQAFRRLVPGLVQNPAFELADAERPLYHAWANLVGNGSAFLGREAVRGLSRQGLPAREILLPFLEGILRNFAADPENCVSGPWARGDEAALARHRHLLASADPGLEALFTALSLRFTSTKESPS